MSEANEFEDMSLTCVCGQPFVWTAGEQCFMHNLFEQGKIDAITNPKRCRGCRLLKKQKRKDAGLS